VKAIAEPQIGREGLSVWEFSAATPSHQFSLAPA